jgi:hypothetical protein
MVMAAAPGPPAGRAASGLPAEGSENLSLSPLAIDAEATIINRSGGRRDSFEKCNWRISNDSNCISDSVYCTLNQAPTREKKILGHNCRFTLHTKHTLAVA